MDPRQSLRPTLALLSLATPLLFGARLNEALGKNGLPHLIPPSGQ